MLDFSLTDEQREIRHLAQRLAAEHLRAQGRTAEKSGVISPAILQALARTGLLTPFPEVYGGSGSLTAMTFVLLAEEFGFGDGGLAMNIIGSLMGPLAVILAGNESQQAQYIPPFCDEQLGVQLHGGLAFAERTGGYSVRDICASIRLDGEHAVLNGAKRDVVHGGDASLRVGLFRLEQTTDLAGLCAVVLPPESVGMEVANDEQKLGLLAAPSASYAFHDVAVPANAILGEPGNSGAIRVAALYSMLRAGIACGIARAALEYASHYAEGRFAFGRPIVSYQGIAFLIAEMAMKLDAARLLLWHAATNWDRALDLEVLVRDAEAAQRQALRIGQMATIDAVQIMGGAGFMQDHPVEMWMRAAAAME